MAIFVAESYLSRERAGELDSVARRLGRDSPVRHLFSYFVAEDETAFHCLDGPSADAVREALERAGLSPDRIAVAEGIPGVPREREAS